MASIFIEGFEQFGPPTIYNGSAITTIPGLSAALAGAGWGIVSSLQTEIVEGLSGQGYALAMGSTSAATPNAVSRSLPTNYTRLMGGFRFTTTLDTNVGCTFYDTSTAQCTINVAPSGLISMFLGSIGSGNTPFAVSLAIVGVSDIHYLEFDITFGTGSNAGGGYTVWLDGVQVFSGTGTMQSSGNPYCNGFEFATYLSAGSTSTIDYVVDDLYLFDQTTAYNNTVLLSNPSVVTQLPIADIQTQFTNQGNVFGNVCAANGGSYSMGANTLYLAPFTSNVNCTVGTIIVTPKTTSVGAHLKGVIYSDVGGVPSALLSSGNQVTGTSANTPLGLTLVTGQTLAAGTQYWIGAIGDTAIGLAEFDGSTHGFMANNTYSSGAPSTAPSMTGSQASIMLYGVCTGATTNWESEAINPVIGDTSSVESNTSGNADIYTFPALPVDATDVYTVGVSGSAKLTVANSHTVHLVTVSDNVPSNGSAGAVTPTTSYGWLDSYFDTDPGTSDAWTVTGLSNANHGMGIAS